MLKKKPILRGTGHGCAHNLLGTTAVMAGIALRYGIEKYGIDATIKCLVHLQRNMRGETFHGKGRIISGVDFFLDWHPWNYNRAITTVVMHTLT